MERLQHSRISACLLYTAEQALRVNAHCSSRRLDYYVQITKEAGLLYIPEQRGRFSYSVEEGSVGEQSSDCEHCQVGEEIYGGHFLHILFISILRPEEGLPSLSASRGKDFVSPIGLRHKVS